MLGTGLGRHKNMSVMRRGRFHHPREKKGLWARKALSRGASRDSPNTSDATSGDGDKPAVRSCRNVARRLLLDAANQIPAAARLAKRQRCPLSHSKQVLGLIAPWSRRRSERRAIHFSIWSPAWDKLTDVDWFSFPCNCEPCLQLTARAMYLSGCWKGTHTIIRLPLMRQLAGDLVGSYFDMFYFSCLLVKLIDS